MYKGAESGPLAECENCGAQLPPPDEKGLRTCTFCKAVYSPPAPAAAPPGVNVVINAPGFTTVGPSTADEFRPINASTRRRRGCGCLSWLLVLAIIAGAVGIPLYISYRNGGFKLPNFATYQFGAQVVPLPGEPGKPIGFLVATRRYDNGRTLWKVIKSNGVDSSPVWESSDLDTSTEPVFSPNGAFVYVVAKAKLLALKQTDGSIAWQATLSDEYATNDCDGCFAVIDKTLVIKTKDDAIQAFDATTGASRWTHDLESTSGKMFHTATKVVVLDEHSDEAKHRTTSLTTLDPSTGAAGTPLLPTCVDPANPRSPDAFSTSDIVAPSTRHPESLYLAYGSSPACFQLWNLDTGALLSNVYLPETSFSTSGFSLAEADDGVLLSNYGEVGFAWAGDSHYQQLAKLDTTQFTVNGVAGTVAVVTAKSSRGTTKTSIQGYDLDTGAKKWDVNMGAATSIDGPGHSSSYSSSYDGTFTSHLAEGKVAILLFTEGHSNSHSLETFTADAATGAPGNRVALDAKTSDLIPDFGPGSWRGGTVAVRVGDDTVQVINVLGAKTEFVMP